MMTNIMVKAYLNQEIMKISNLIEEKIKNNACPRQKFNRKPNFTECSEVPKCGLNTRHDNREVTLPHLTQAQILRSDK